MKASIDISMYPLQDHYCPAILAFIADLEQRPDIHIERNALSTQIFGDYRTLMNALTEDVEKVLKQNPKTIFVIKLVGTDRSNADIDNCGDA